MVMNKGQVVEHGTTADVLGAPKHEYTQTLIGAVMGETLNAAKRSGAERSGAGLP
jgi:ABC-type antimicrobial peptide transport system ATPase subunit